MTWTDPLAATRSFALVVDDPDAPNGPFTHRGLYDIPGATRRLPEGVSDVGASAANDFLARSPAH